MYLGDEMLLWTNSRKYLWITMDAQSRTRRKRNSPPMTVMSAPAVSACGAHGRGPALRTDGGMDLVALEE